MLEFNKVTFKYKEDDYTMMKDLSFLIKEGEFVSIIGASGCGKSTILRLINGLENPQGGEILFKGTKVQDIKGISAYMPQRDLLFPWRTIRKNLELPLELKGTSKATKDQMVKEVLKEVGLEGYIDKYPRELSGGMRQRAAFARTLLTGSDLLLLDEPFSALDSLTKMSMQEWLLKQYDHLKKTIVFITHDVEEAIFLSTVILVVVDKPITHLERIEIPMEYPRHRGNLKKQEILDLKEELIERLRQKVEL